MWGDSTADPCWAHSYHQLSPHRSSSKELSQHAQGQNYKLIPREMIFRLLTLLSFHTHASEWMRSSSSLGELPPSQAQVSTAATFGNTLTRFTWVLVIFFFPFLSPSTENETAFHSYWSFIDTIEYSSLTSLLGPITVVLPFRHLLQPPVGLGNSEWDRDLKEFHKECTRFSSNYRLHDWKLSVQPTKLTTITAFLLHQNKTLERSPTGTPGRMNTTALQEHSC